MRLRNSTERTAAIQFRGGGFGGSRWRRFSGPPERNQEQPGFQTLLERQHQQLVFATSIKIFGQSISEIAFRRL